MASEPVAQPSSVSSQVRDRLCFTEKGVELLRAAGASGDLTESRSPETDRERNQAAIRLLKIWADEDDGGEQKETLDFIMKALDEDRPGQRKLFS